MQVKLKFSLVLSFAACFFSVRAIAQDEGQPSPEVQELNQQHPELNLSDDKTLLMDMDAKATKTQSGTHEASPTATGNKNKSDSSAKPSGEKTDEDPLSFNFLYFIIQKFKISDIVDD